MNPSGEVEGQYSALQRPGLSAIRPRTPPVTAGLPGCEWTAPRVSATASCSRDLVVLMCADDDLG
eukprot:CAMPEP_0182528382 /NCGR_PEP_ID=MMETSP1323-20130603/4476_1 /TAXON_ID=236787 /ORGANISM="Florenciella parvula, Strain RCC1693" /LENGTH=64 /DNA_ID=CAMNT_0024737495 /DNA_START=161 /DNA_END=355 /DNA_ORIENTATION=-